MSDFSEYHRMIASKRIAAVPTGIRRTLELNPAMFDYQAACTQFALRAGRSALFLDTGMGKSLCPLQLDVIQRCLELYTNPNDVVYSPFTGIGSEGFVSLREGRRFIGTELKSAYFKQAVKNLKEAELRGPVNDLLAGAVA